MTSTHCKPATVVLVTGGAGYIGSHTCKALAQAGYLPVTIDDLSRGHSSAVKWGPLIVGSVGDRDLLDSIMTQYRPTAVLHFAAFAYVGESVRNPAQYFRNNTCYSLTLLEATQDHDIDALVFSSTCAIYGIPQRVPIQEHDHQNPVNPYGQSKLMVEGMLRSFDAAHGMRFISLRYFNAAGSDSEREIGWCHDPETRLIPRALMAARGDLPHLEIFGGDFETPDGTCVRDYIHVSDLARAHVLALQHLRSGSSSRTLNIGAGTGHSVHDVVNAVHRVTGMPVPIKIASRRTGDPAVLVANSSQASSVLKFTPLESSLDHIVRTAWEWMKRR